MPSTLTKQSTTYHLSILVWRSGGRLVADCIEHHLATRARSRDELDRAIALMFTKHEADCRELGRAPYFVKLAPLAVRVAYDLAPTCTTSWVFTPGGSRLRLTVREGGFLDGMQAP